MKKEQSIAERYEIAHQTILSQQPSWAQTRIGAAKNVYDILTMRDPVIRVFIKDVIELAESDKPLIKNEKAPATEEKTK